MKKILLLSCGTNACYHFAKIIKKYFQNDFYIVGADINEKYLIPSFNLIDKFYKVPLSKDKNYYSYILKILEEENIDFILPNFDYDQVLFYPENPDLIKLNVKSLSTSKKSLKFYKDKLLMQLKLNENEFLTPKLFKINELKDGTDYFLKPKDGVGSIGATKASKSEILNKNNIENYLIQECCFEPEITVECFNYNGNLSTVARERIATKSGVCTKAKIYHDEELENIIKDFVSKIPCPLYFNLQFMKNAYNEWVITDVNFRLAGGMGLSYCAGWDETSAILKVLLNKSDDDILSTLKLNAPVQYAIKAYTDIITKTVPDTIAYDLDGTILNSFKRHTIVMQKALEKFNINLDLVDYIDFKRCGNNNLDYLLSKGIENSVAIKVQQYWIENIENLEFLETDFLYDGILDELENLSKEHELILITARNNKENLYKQIEKYGINKYFKEIFVVPSDKNTFRAKSEILKKFNVKYMVGDTESDKKACIDANIEFRFYEHGFRKNLELIIN